MICLEGAAKSDPVALLFSPGLHHRDDRQHVVQPLVVDDRRTMHRSQRVEGSVGQGKALVQDLKPPVRLITDDFLARQRPGNLDQFENNSTSS